VVQLNHSGRRWAQIGLQNQLVEFNPLYPGEAGPCRKGYTRYSLIIENSRAYPDGPEQLKDRESGSQGSA
jgi:hypothetical protein